MVVEATRANPVGSTAVLTQNLETRIYVDLVGGNRNEETGRFRFQIPAFAVRRERVLWRPPEKPYRHRLHGLLARFCLLFKGLTS